MQIEPPECTRCSTENGAVPAVGYFILDCGCLDVLYVDDGICYEHNHVKCTPVEDLCIDPGFL